MKWRTRLVLGTAAVAFAVWLAASHLGRAGQEEEAKKFDLSRTFDKTDVMIPMRDGVHLHTEIYAPKNTSEPLPFFLTRTPYGLNDDAQGYSRLFGLYEEMIPEGYIFVFQDIRGRFKSEGQFVMNRPPRDPNDTRAIDEATDTYDTIDWLLKNVPHHNGRVGEAGISYGGWLTLMALLDPHPALKAASEQASPADFWIGDDFFHNGAFRLSYGFEYAAMMETDKTNSHFNFDRYDTYAWYLLELGPLANADAKYLHGTLPTWEDFVNHPAYDAFWQKGSAARDVRQLKQLTVPDLNVAGWWDQEDFYGPLTIYETLEKRDPNHFNYLVVGPWNHGGWAHGSGRSLGKIDFGSNTSEYFRQHVQAPWFAYWLKDKGKPPAHKVLTFETGANQWKEYAAWPPEDVGKRALYLASDGKLSINPPQAEGRAAESAFDSYVSDPANPVPYRHRPVSPTYPGPGWPTWLVEDQRLADHRPDTLSWETEPLDHDVCVAGRITAHLFASTSGTDSDWVVKLIDVYPEAYEPDPSLGGYELMIAGEVLRARYRKSIEHPLAVPANQPVPYTINLHTNNHCFQKGHRLMVEVQSTWFPLYDRNPQKFVPNIFKASAADYQKATQKVYRSKEYPSNVELPVTKE